MIQLGGTPLATRESRLAPFVILAGGLFYQQHSDSIVSWTEPKPSLPKEAFLWFITLEAATLFYVALATGAASVDIKTCCTCQFWGYTWRKHSTFMTWGWKKNYSSLEFLSVVSSFLSSHRVFALVYMIYVLLKVVLVALEQVLCEERLANS